MNRNSTVTVRRGFLALMVLACLGIAWSDAFGQLPLDGLVEQVEKSALEKAAADRVRAEKIAAQQAATATAQAAAEAAKKAAEARLAAERAGASEARAVAEKIATTLEAEAQTHKAAIEKANSERAEADKVVQERTAALNDANQKLTAARAPLDQASGQASKVATDAQAAREAAQTVLNEKSAAATNAANVAAASQDVAAKAEAERATAEKAAAEAAATAKTAAEAAAASQAAATQMAADQSTTAKLLEQKTAMAIAAVDAAAASQVAAGQAATEQAAAAKAVEDKGRAAKSAADTATASQATATQAAADVAAATKVVEEKVAAAKAATAAAAAEQDAAKKKALDETAAKAAAEQAAAEKVLAEKTAAAKAAADSAAAAKSTADTAAAEKAAAEKILVDKTAAVKAATDKAAADKVAAENAAAEKAAAEKALAEKSALAKAAGDKAAADKASSDKLAADKATADKALADKSAAAKTAGDKAAADKAASDKATGERTAGENDVAAKSAAEKSAWHKAAEARAIAEGGLKVLPENEWDYAKARHLSVRAGFGGTPEEVARLHQMGLVRAVEYLVDYQYVPAEETAFRIDPPERPLPTEGKLSEAERNRLNQRRDAQRNNDFNRLRIWWMRRLVESPRPLQEKLTLFWHGHFATEWQKIAWPHLMFNQNQLFRDHAAGNLGALLYGIVHDPAMIVYLDNQINYKGHPNQNLARELMELFSMGVNQGYSEYDLREGARALTGYSYEHYTGQFRFNYNQHDTDPKTIFGQTGSWTGDDFVNLILQQPHTGRFISAKLFEFFAYSNPDPQVVTRLAAVLRLNQFELAPMLKSLFMSQEFYSPRAMGNQIKSPVQLLVGLHRDFGAKAADYNALVAWCADMGQELFQPPNVKGWYGGRDWVNANLVFRRYNYIASTIQSVAQPNGQRGLDVVAALEGKGLTAPMQVVEHLARCCLLVPLNDEQRKSLADYLGQLPPAEEWPKQRDQLNARLRQLLILMLSTAEYQMT